MRIEPLHQRTLTAIVAATALLSACAGGGPGNGDDSATDDSGATDTGPEVTPWPDGCRSTPAPEDSVRAVVVSHPFSESGNARTWELLQLASDGTMSRPGVTWEMGRATEGEVVFTPDGQVGLVPQENGSLGVFTVSGTTVSVRETDFGRQDFFASAVVVEPSGERAWVVDDSLRNNGGGLHEITIDCSTGAVAVTGRVLPADRADALLLHPEEGGLGLIVASDVLDLTGPIDAAMVRLEGEGEAFGGIGLFPDTQASRSAAAWTHDTEHVLVTDNSTTSTVDNRIGVGRVTEAGLEAVQVLAPVQDPWDVETSPFDDVALVSSRLGDAVFQVTYDAAADPPFALAGEVAYTGSPPARPKHMQSIDRGSLAGTVLLAETQGVRQLSFAGSGSVTDGGLYSLGTGRTNIVGAFGVQP